jgi:peptidoglycan/xylan/chitin deacetylase (PgdA/CDA1 family)
MGFDARFSGQLQASARNGHPPFQRAAVDGVCGADSSGFIGGEAGPILREMEVPATVFVTSEVAREGGDFWWDRFFDVVHAADDSAWRRLVTREGMAPLERTDPEQVGRLRETLLARYAGRVELPDVPAPGGLWRSATFEELRRMGEWDGIDFGVHTATHPVLPLLQPDEQGAEISGCAETLRDNLPSVVPILAYPYGFFSPITESVAAESGMHAAVTIEGFCPPRRPDLYAIPRIGVGNAHSTRSIRMRLARMMRFPLVLRNGKGIDQIPRAAAMASSAK